VVANARDNAARGVSSSLLRRILHWLRAGYPERAPGPDRVPLLALLCPTPLTEDQVEQVVRNLTTHGLPTTVDGEFDTDEIAAFITEVTHHDAGPENVQRVADRLAACRQPDDSDDGAAAQ
jgi:hypothetical protein